MFMLTVRSITADDYFIIYVVRDRPGHLTYEPFPYEVTKGLSRLAFQGPPAHLDLRSNIAQLVTRNFRGHNL
jgi:hypothetical protein